jgi:hypothetical protein
MDDTNVIKFKPKPSKPIPVAPVILTDAEKAAIFADWERGFAHHLTGLGLQVAAKQSEYVLDESAVGFDQYGHSDDGGNRLHEDVLHG